MSFRGFLSALAILCALAMPAAAQVPTPTTTTFDGKYLGTGTITHENPSDFGICRTITSVYMTITRGRVAIYIKYYNTEGVSTYLGTVNEAGEVSTSREVGNRWITVSSIIHDRVFTGASSAHASSRNTCFYSFEMAPAPPLYQPPFDGWYTGVSREVLDGGSNEPRCYPRALTPPRGFAITDGVVRNPRDQWWEGTVSPQGAVVIRNPRFSRVEGQIEAR